MRVLPIALIATSLIAGGGAVAAAVTASSAPTSLKGCVNSKDQFDILHSGRCAKGYSAVTFAVKGPRGATGAKGVAGPRGATGPGAVSSYLHSTTNTHTTPLKKTLAVPGTHVSLVSTCAVTYDSTAYARLDLKTPGAGYLEGSETGTFAGSGSAALSGSFFYTSGAENIATNTQGDAYLYVYAGSQSAVVTVDVDVIDTTTAKPTIVHVQATVISEQGECLAVVTATPSTNAGI